MNTDTLELIQIYKLMVSKSSVYFSGLEFKGECTVKNDTCAVQQALENFKIFAAETLCAKCSPCLVGTGQAIDLLERLQDGTATPDDAHLLERICRQAEATVRCKKGRDIFTAVGSLLDAEKEEFLTHVQDRQCPAGKCAALISYRIEADKCTHCDRCRQVCPAEAIVGEPVASYRVAVYPYEIIDVKCTRCGDCVAACDAGAIRVY